jgi:hypothetical protein
MLLHVKVTVHPLTISWPLPGSVWRACVAALAISGMIRPAAG